MRFLLFGLGNIGIRHRDLLVTAGHDVVSVDPDLDKVVDYHSALPLDIVEMDQFDGVLDCTPPSIRIGWTTPAKARFIEKPLGSTCIPLTASSHYIGEPIMLGFCYRWLFSLENFVEDLSQHDIYSLTIVGGQPLQDWHAEDYREHRSRYHGVVLDSLPHSLFIARWILGDLELSAHLTAHLSDLDIDTPDTAAALLVGSEGQPVYVLADYYRSPRQFYVEAVTCGGVKKWEFQPHTDANTMYWRQMDNFVKLCKGEDIGYYPTLQDGVKVQEILDAIGG